MQMFFPVLFTLISQPCSIVIDINAISNPRQYSATTQARANDLLSQLSLKIKNDFGHQVVLSALAPDSHDHVNSITIKLSDTTDTDESFYVDIVYASNNIQNQKSWNTKLSVEDIVKQITNDVNNPIPHCSEQDSAEQQVPREN